MSQHLHLLNFRYERPAVEHQHASNYYGRRKPGTRPRLKEQFLQANYRFVISPHAPPAHPALYDADTLIDWDYVDQVYLSTPEGVENHCPICLGPPKAPKITRCGHIFCSACILRHLGMYRVRRCPMCYENTCRTDLRPVEVVATRRLEAKGRLEFLLLSRVKGTLTPKKIEGAGKEVWKPEAGECVDLWSILPPVGSDNAVFSRLTSDTVAHETACMGREEQELREAAHEAQTCGEEEWLPFVEEALQQLQERRIKNAARRGQEPPPDIPGSTRSSSATKRAGGSSPPTRGLRSRSNSVEDEPLPPPPASPAFDHKAVATAEGAEDGGAGAGADEREAKAAPSGEPVSFFFQLSDGQYVFLHPLNMRCLMADAEGQHAKLPTRVEGKVLEVEAMTLTPELRSRYNFLKHLPLYSHIQLVELDLRPLLSEATYAQFKAEIKKRQQRRKTKERTEKGRKRTDDAKGLGGIGLTEEEIQEIKSRRETVNLDGPLPWQAMLIGEERDPEKVQQAMQALQSDTEVVAGAGAGAGAPEAADSGEVPGSGGGAVARGSFAEITKMNGNFPSLGDSFPPLGSSPSSSGLEATLQQSKPTATLSASPPGRGSLVWGVSPPSTSSSPAVAGVWGARNPLLSSSPPQAPVWVPRAASLAKAQASQAPAPAPGQGAASDAHTSEFVLQPLRTTLQGGSGSSLSAGEQGPTATTGTPSDGKKKKKQALTLFSTASQRKYST